MSKTFCSLSQFYVGALVLYFLGQMGSFSKSCNAQMFLHWNSTNQGSVLIVALPFPTWKQPSYICNPPTPPPCTDGTLHLHHLGGRFCNRQLCLLLFRQYKLHTNTFAADFVGWSADHETLGRVSCLVRWASTLGAGCTPNKCWRRAAVVMATVSSGMHQLSFLPLSPASALSAPAAAYF